MSDAPLLPSRLIVIADGFTRAVRCRVVQQLLAEAPPFWLHLRDHDAEAELFFRTAQRMARWNDARTAPCTISINRKIDVAERLGLHFHTGQTGPAVSDARARLGPDFLVGYSAHQSDDARGIDADYFFFSPIFAPGSKPGVGVGLESLSRFVRDVSPVPVFALGGITPARTADCIRAGAFGVAVVSAVMDVNEPVSAVGRFVDVLGDSGVLGQAANNFQTR